MRDSILKILFIIFIVYLFLALINLESTQYSWQYDKTTICKAGMVPQVETTSIVCVKE